MPLTPPVRHLLVDLDGTLLGNRSVPLSLEFARRSLEAMRKYGGWRKSVRTLLTIQQELKRASRETTNDNRVIRHFAEAVGVPHEEGRRLLREHLAAIFPALERHFYPVPGAREFLEWARERYPLTLATNPVWPPEIVELRVRWAGIDPSIFGFVTHVRRMHACKPEKAYYEEILELQGLKADECLLVGDDVKMDLPATKAGVRVFIVGKYARLARLEPKGARAQAWRGSYADLRALLTE
jgi:FMN phosphatase YigB (HAD superfamily)